MIHRPFTRCRFPCLAVGWISSLVLVAGCSGADNSDAEGEGDLSEGLTGRLLKCRDSKPKDTESDSYTLEAKIASSTKLRNVKFTAVDDGYMSIGTASKQEANPDYSPIRYRDSNQFKLDLQTSTGKHFSPGDTCELQLLLPRTLGSMKAGATFTGRVIANCDQSGGSLPFYCSID